MRRVAPWCVIAVLACDRSPGVTGAMSSPEATAPASQDAEVTDAAQTGTVTLEAAVEAAAPAPAVAVENIGMHIGGGPNDTLSKAPIANSVAPHFDELRACWRQVGDPSRGGDFGVDLLIPAEGGRAVVSHPRTSLGPDAFRACIVAVFTAVDFRKPRTGRTTVSYSLRFSPPPAPSR